MSCLQEYLKLKKSAQPGWGEKAAFIFGEFGESGHINYAYLCGAYGSFLDELIDVIGIDTAIQLIDAMEAIKARCHHMREAQK